LRRAHGSAQGPEVRIGEEDVDGVELHGVEQLPPVGGDHVRRGGNAGGATKLRHGLAAGVSALRAAGVLGIGEDMLLAAAEANRLVERPRAVWVERDAGL